MGEPLRLRVVFDHRKMLTRSQRSEGLKRCWLLVKPDVATISDLASLVSKRFKLKRSCPHGLVLTMDDFVLPPFETIFILKDKDIIRVRKKDAKSMDVIEIGDDPHYIQDSDVVYKQHIVSSDRLLAIRDCEEDSGQRKNEKNKNDEHLCEHDEIYSGNPSKSIKKRKHSDETQGSKKKKLKISSSPNVVNDKDGGAWEDKDNNLGLNHKRDSYGNSSGGKYKHSNGHSGPEALIASHLGDNAENVTVQKEKRRKKSKSVIPENAIIASCDIPTEKDKNCSQKSCSSKKSLQRNDEQADEDGRSDAEAAIPSQIDDSTIKKPCSVIIAERNVQSEENVNGNICEKVPSRSARRKKAKREYKKEGRFKKSQNIQSEMPPDVINRESAEQQEPISNTNVEKEIVPVVVRPGHIRFQPSDEEHIQRQPEETMQALQWNGTTSKKKGQKWGREKTADKWNNANGYSEHSNGVAASEKEKTGSNPTIDGYEQVNGKAICLKGRTGSSSIHFDGLFPLTRIPQVGDVIAYRLIELSSSWCPEVSPFRVGQVTSYNYLNMNIILVPVPEYPIFSDEDMEGRDSVYNDDGSLLIHYPSLVDVRLVKATDSEATTSANPGNETNTHEEPPPNKWELAVANTSQAKEPAAEPRTKPTTQPAENGDAGASTWDQIKQAISEKKAELEKKNEWDEWAPKKSTASTSWSYRALRGSAVGPTLAYLRGRNNNNNNRQGFRR